MSKVIDSPLIRTIFTARTVDEINAAAGEGFWPLVKKIVLSDKIKSKYAVW